MFCCCANEGTKTEEIIQQVAAMPGLDVQEQAALSPAAKEEEPTALPLKEQPGFGPDLVTKMFTIKITREEGKGIGLDISAHDGSTLLIGRVKDGPVITWNTAPDRDPFERVRRGDRIISMNGASGSSDAILHELKAGGPEFTAVIRRVTQIRVTFSRNAPLGLERDESISDYFVVKSVADGCMKDANRKNKADMEVKAADTIVQVNNQTGDAVTLWSLVQSAPELSLLVRRPTT